jgi:LPS-assembly lipoprotein
MPRATPALRLVITALLAAALVSACGFRARGSVTLPEDFREVYVDAPIEIADEIAIFLDSGGASIAGVRSEADAVIKVLSESYDERVMSVDATTGKAREFELLYAFDFSIRMKDGIMLIPPEHVVVRRIYLFDPTDVIGGRRNIEVLRQDMRREAAGRIIRLTEAALGS